MASDNERRLILQMIESGKISAAEGLQLLKALEEAEDAGSPTTALSDSGDSETPLRQPQEQETAATSRQDFVAQGEAKIPSQATAALPSQVPGWRRWWLIPLGVGLSLVFLAAWWMQQVIQTEGLSWEFYCAWLPLALGLVMILLAWQSRSGRWL